MSEKEFIKKRYLKSYINGGNYVRGKYPLTALYEEYMEDFKKENTEYNFFTFCFLLKEILYNKHGELLSRDHLDNYYNNFIVNNIKNQFKNDLLNLPKIKSKIFKII